MDGPGGAGDAPVNERPTFTSRPIGKGAAVTAAATARRPLIAMAAIGVVAAAIGIGASIAGVDDDRDAAPAGSTTTAAPTTVPPAEEPAPEDEEAAEEADEARLEAEAAVGRDEAERIAQARVPGPVDRARISDEGGTPTWEVRIDTEHGHTDVLVDATTGAVLAVDD